MQTNQFYLVAVYLGLMIIQLLVNNISTFLYLDFLGVFLVVLLLTESYSWSGLIIYCLLSDILGHWYLGTHLLASTVLSLISGYFINYYKMSTFIQRVSILVLFYSLLRIIIVIIGVVLHNPSSGWLSYLCELLIVPLVLLMFNRYILKHGGDLFFS